MTRSWEPILYHPSAEVEAVGMEIDRLADERPHGWREEVDRLHRKIEEIEERERNE